MKKAEEKKFWISIQADGMVCENRTVIFADGTVVWGSGEEENFPDYAAALAAVLREFGF